MDFLRLDRRVAALFFERREVVEGDDLLERGQLRAERRELLALCLVLDESDLRAVDPTLGTIFNLNTPDDYRAALRRAGFEDDENRYPAGGASGTIG